MVDAVEDKFKGVVYAGSVCALGEALLNHELLVVRLDSRS